MPPSAIYDLSKLDPNKIVVPHEEIYKIIPQRFEWEMLTAVIYENYDTGIIVGYRDIAVDEYWVRGHIPGRPLMPGVLMIECAAQLCAYWTMKRQPEMGFVGFAKCDQTRFRGTVVPPSRLFMTAQIVELSRRRAIGKCQGVNQGTLIFESLITGMSV